VSDVDRSALQAVYRYALDHGLEEGFARSAVGPATGLPETVVTAAVEELLAMGLLLGLAAGRLRAVAPGEAVSGVITPLERELRARRAAIEDTRAAIMSFLPLYEREQVARERKNGFEILPDLAAVRVAIADLTARARVEILTAQPGGARGEGVLAEASPRDLAALRRGVRMRVLYQHTARFSRGTGEYVDRVRSPLYRISTIVLMALAVGVALTPILLVASFDSLPFPNFGPARTRATRRGALTGRGRTPTSCTCG
jgi:hypothetical protein